MTLRFFTRPAASWIDDSMQAEAIRYVRGCQLPLTECLRRGRLMLPQSDIAADLTVRDGVAHGELPCACVTSG